jgi:hypothetical protein
MRSNVNIQLRNLATQMHSSRIGYQEAMERFEAEFVSEAVRSSGGNQCKAAETLGSRRWFVVWRLSSGRVWPRELLNDEGQALATESELLGSLPVKEEILLDVFGDRRSA